MKRILTITALVSGFAISIAPLRAGAATASNQCTPAAANIALPQRAAIPAKADQLARTTPADLKPNPREDLRRSEIIQRLKLARQEDDRNEQQMLNELAWSDSGSPAVTAQFEEHKALVDDVLQQINNGDPVDQLKIKQALAVPVAP
jgi:hypothetical protein